MNEFDFEEIIRQIAKDNNVTAEEVLHDLNEALDYGANSQDPDVQSAWNAVPRNEEKPTAEEVISFLVSEVIKGCGI